MDKIWFNTVGELVEFLNQQPLDTPVNLEYFNSWLDKPCTEQLALKIVDGEVRFCG